MPGPRPKPDELKALAGNPGHRPLNLEAPKPEKGAPEKPKGMGHVANREWDLMMELLGSMGLLYRTDGKALGEYCKLIGLAEAYYKVVLKEPMIEEPVLDKDGLIVDHITKKNPALQAYLDCTKAARSYLIEFGLTPASRSRLKIEAPKPVDPMELLLTRKPKAAAAAAKENAPLHFDIGATKQKPEAAKAISESDTNFDA